MPELPEVETVVRTIAPFLEGRKIVRAAFFSPHVVRQNFEELSAALADRLIQSVRRHGKFIVIELDRGSLVIHLGMTGKLLVHGTPGAHARAIFELDDGQLIYDDIRHFGRIEWSPELPERVSSLGPDPLSVSEEEFRTMLHGRQARVKALLLNQRFLRGIGNIYADETLFASGIHPLAQAAKLSRQRVSGLYQSMQQILRQAIASRGSSISDYVDAEGRAGSFQLFHQVYGKGGKPCPRCGAVIERTTVAQRGTHYCPRCQRM